MSVGLMLPTYLERRDRFRLAEKADEFGIDAVFTGESASSNLFIDLTWVAANTSDVRLGAGIVNVFTRSPSLIGLSAAELDAISDGRLILGLGPSTPPLIEGLHGMSFDHPIARTSEYIDILRAGWTGEKLHHDGEFYSPSGGRLREVPEQDHLPIAIASLGPANRRLTGAKADVWLPHLVPKTVLDTLAEDVYESARTNGRSSDDVEVCAYVPTAVGKSIDEQRDRIRSHVAAYAGSAGPYRDIVARAGYEAIADEVHKSWQNDERDAARAAITDELVDDIGIAATPSTMDDEVARWHDSGADMVILNFPPGTTVDEIRLALDSAT